MDYDNGHDAAAAAAANEDEDGNGFGNYNSNNNNNTNNNNNNNNNKLVTKHNGSNNFQLFASLFSRREGGGGGGGNSSPLPSTPFSRMLPGMGSENLSSSLVTGSSNSIHDNYSSAYGAASNVRRIGFSDLVNQLQFSRAYSVFYVAMISLSILLFIWSILQAGK